MEIDFVSKVTKVFALLMYTTVHSCKIYAILQKSFKLLLNIKFRFYPVLRIRIGKDFACKLLGLLYCT